MCRLGPLFISLLLVTVILSGSIILTPPVSSSDARAPFYHTSGELGGALRSLSLSHPEIAEYRTSSELLGVRDVPGGREIPLLFIGDRDEVRPWVMLVGAHHGDEPDSAEVVLGFAQYLIDAYRDDDQRAKDIIDNINIALLPVVNPYGLDTGSRYDENDEDPNRDYPFTPAVAGPHSDGTPLTTAGAMTVHELASRYPFSIALSFHTGSEGIYTPWGAPTVGNITPDGNCFMDMAMVLQRASGRSLPYGPANDFGYLGNLKGAMEDHLYGSMFLSDRLFTPEMALPWSSFTATVELLNRKGQDPEMLGTLEGVMDPGGPDDGTLPMGVRISLAACKMASPSMEGSIVYDEDDRVLELSLSGTVSSVPSIEPTPDSMVRSGGQTFLPEVTYRAVWSGAGEGNGWVNASLFPDPLWPKPNPDADPVIAPVSLLSHTRGVAGSPRELSLSFMIEGKVGPAPTLPTVAMVEVEPETPEAGSLAFIELVIDQRGIISTGLTINASCGGTWSVTEIEGGDVINGTSWYIFELPLASGLTRLDITLRSNRGLVSAIGMVLTEPRIYIMTLTTNTHEPDWMTMLVGVDGTYEPVVIMYGIVRNNGKDWIRGPFYQVYSTADSLFIDMNISGIGGDISFVVGRADGTITDSRDRSIDRDIRIIGATISQTADSLVLGPALIVQNANGLAPVEPDENSVSFEVEVINLKVDLLYFSGDLPFVLRRDLGPDMIITLDNLAIESGLNPDLVNGCYLSYIPVPSSSTMMAAEFHAWGAIRTPADIHPINFNTGYMDSRPLSVEVDEKDEDGPFPWALIVFILLTAIVVMIVTALRYNAHWREPQPDPRDLPHQRLEGPHIPYSEQRSRRVEAKPKGPPLPRGRTKDQRTRGGRSL